MTRAVSAIFDRDPDQIFLQEETEGTEGGEKQPRKTRTGLGIFTERNEGHEEDWLKLGVRAQKGVLAPLQGAWLFPRSVRGSSKCGMQNETAGNAESTPG